MSWPRSITSSPVRAWPGWPEALEDLREAVRWLRRHAEEYDIDSNRIVAIGGSAGGHLAALLGSFSPGSQPERISSHVQAVIDLYGPMDLAELLTRRDLVNEPIRLLLGGDPATIHDRARAASPIQQVTREHSPMLLVHGSEDRWVPPEQSDRMADRLARAGVRCQLITVAGERHGFELQSRYPTNRDLLPDLLAFLESVWQVDLGEHR